MKKLQMLVDQKSYELAEYFLQDFRSIQKVDIQALAEDIQSTVENFIGELEEVR